MLSIFSILLSLTDSGTVNTGYLHVSRTSAVTLPTSSRSLVWAPRVPITIITGAFSFAYWFITSSGIPSCISDVSLTTGSSPVFILDKRLSVYRSICLLASFSMASNSSAFALFESNDKTSERGMEFPRVGSVNVCRRCILDFSLLAMLNAILHAWTECGEKSTGTRIFVSEFPLLGLICENIS